MNTGVLITNPDSINAEKAGNNLVTVNNKLFWNDLRIKYGLTLILNIIFWSIVGIILLILFLVAWIPSDGMQKGAKTWTSGGDRPASIDKVNGNPYLNNKTYNVVAYHDTSIWHAAYDSFKLGFIPDGLGNVNVSFDTSTKDIYSKNANISSDGADHLIISEPGDTIGSLLFNCCSDYHSLAIIGATAEHKEFVLVSGSGDYVYVVSETDTSIPLDRYAILVTKAVAAGGTIGVVNNTQLNLIVSARRTELLPRKR
jgi:hypothetical protein